MMRTLRTMQLAILVACFAPVPALAFLLGRRTGRPAGEVPCQRREAALPSCACHPQDEQCCSTSRQPGSDAGQVAGMIVQTLRLTRLMAVVVAMVTLLTPLAFWLGNLSERPLDPAAARSVPSRLESPVPVAAQAGTAPSVPPGSGAAYVFQLESGAFVVLPPAGGAASLPSEALARFASQPSVARSAEDGGGASPPPTAATVPLEATTALSTPREAPAPPALPPGPDTAASPPPQLPLGAFVVWLPPGSAPSLPS